MSAGAIGKGIVCASLAAALIWLEPLEGQSTAPAVPASIRPLLDRGLAYYRNGEVDSAISVFDEAIRLLPTFARAYVLRGSSYMLKGYYENALADFNQAIHIDPRNAAAYCDRADLKVHFLSPLRGRLSRL